MARGGTPPTLYVQPGAEAFETYVSAAIIKKKVPVTMLTNAEGADYVLKAGPAGVHKPSTPSKNAHAGIESSATASVQLLKGESVVWSHSVDEGRDQNSQQALAARIAKQLKDEFFKP